MRICLTFVFTAISASETFAGAIIPMPGAGVAGPAALLAAVGAVVGVRYLRNRRSK
jgi:hypothetical protein